MRLPRAASERPSLRARLLGAFLRRVVKPRTRHMPDPLLSRALVESFALPRPPWLRVRAARVGDIPGEWVVRRRADPAAPVLLLLHGGAYALGSPATHRPLAAAFAGRGFRVFTPAYRLAPEHPFPAALDDAVAVYRGLLAEGTAPGRIAVAGDSAGGGLALAALVRLRDLAVRLPAAAALFSPWTDLACTGGSMRQNAERDPLFEPVHADAVAALYLGGADPTDPGASPLFADLAGLPPLLVHVGEDEILLDDSRRVAEKASAAGVEVAYRVWPAVMHGWQLLSAVLPEARRSVDEAAAFLHQRCRAADPARALHGPGGAGGRR